MTGPATITPISMLQFLLKLVVLLSNLFTNESVDMSGNEGGVMGDERGGPYVDVLTFKLDKYMLVVMAHATRPPDGLCQNQAQVALPMV